MFASTVKAGGVQLPQTARLLGAAGVLPFVAGAAVAVVASGEPGAVALSGLGAYALAITSFLCGAWWGIALIRRAPGLLLASNGIVITAWLALWLLPPSASLLVLAVLLTVTVGVEARHRAFAAQPAYYRTLRLRLTAVATVCLVVAAVLA